jgi:spermidine/putrescine transport system substrate-binding protein
MKRLVALSLFVALACTLGITGCAKKTGDSTLYVYNWTYYIPDDVVKQFEKESGIKVVYDVYASNEEMYAKIKAGGTGYDLVVPSGDYVSIMIAQGMLEKLDKSKIPNFANIDPTILPKINFDKGNEYSVPYFMAAAGISVNKTLVKSYDKSWNIFSRTDLKNKMTMLDDMREVMGDALKTLGYSVNTHDQAQIDKAKDLVLKWKENIVKFDAESFAKGFANGEFSVVQGYAENVFLEYDPAKRSDVDFFIPKEGGPMYMDSMCILKGAKHQDAAYKFMNYIHRPDVYAKIADFLMLPSVNFKAREVEKVKPNYTIDDMKNCEFKEDLGTYLDMYNKAWQEIRVGK